MAAEATQSENGEFSSADSLKVAGNVLGACSRGVGAPVLVISSGGSGSKVRRKGHSQLADENGDPRHRRVTFGANSAINSE